MTTRKIVRNGAVLTGRVVKSAYTTTDKVVGSLFKIVTTDHLGIVPRLLNMPNTGFLDGLYHLGITAVSAIVGALVVGGLWFLIIAFGVPALLNLVFGF